MSLLDLQTLETVNESCDWHGGEGGSELSLLLCDSALSVTVCL